MREIEKEFGIEPQLYKRKEQEGFKIENELKENVKKSKPKPKTKFIASKNSSVYHVKNCAFAKRIKAKDMVIFNSKISAGRKKYKAHSCVK